GRHGPGPAAAPLGSAQAGLRRAVTPQRQETYVPDELASRLRGSGYRLTPQRQLVLAAVEALGHATPDEVRDHLEGAVNTSTVYRNRAVLEELGLARHTHLSDRAPTSHSAREAEHFHLVCRECQRVTSVDPSQAAPFLEQMRTVHG